PENPHPVAHPQAHDPQHLVIEPAGVVVEVERVDVLVFLGRVLGVGDGAVGAMAEPIRVLGDPGVIGGCLQGQVERHFHAEFAGAGHERVEVGERAQLWVDRIVAAGRGADSPRRARVARPGVQGVVAPLAGRGPDGVDGRQVDHVEAHAGDALQPARRGAQRAAHRLPAAHRVDLHALRAGEELVPGAVQRPLPVHHERVGGRTGKQFAQRGGLQDLRDLLVVGGGHPIPGGDPPVGQLGRQGGEGHTVSGRPCRGPGRAVEQRGSLRQHQLHVLAPGHLDAGVMAPMADRVSPGFHVEPPPALGGRGDLGRIAVGAGEDLVHPGQRQALAGRTAQHHSSAGNLVSLADDGGADFEGFPDHCLGRAAPAVGHRLYVADDYPTHPPRTPPSMPWWHPRRPRSPHRRVPVTAGRVRDHATGAAPPPRSNPESPRQPVGSLCVRAIRRFTIRASLPEPLAPLHDLMLNLRWSWHGATRDLFTALDPAARAEAGRDPTTLLGEVPPEHLARLAADKDYLDRLHRAAADLQEYLSAAQWYQRGGEQEGAAPAGRPAAIAYFSPEYGIAAALPQYSGGLGILAGDHLKAASDLGVPLIGVGLLSRNGSFSQSLTPEGWQLERYPAGDPNGLPLTLLRGTDGSPVTVVLALGEGSSLAAQVWLAQVGRVPLLLLDSYVAQNEPGLREVTDRLYGGGSEHR